MILVGTFKARPVAGILAFSGVVFGMIYILRMVQDTLFGEARKEYVLWDVDAREIIILGSLALAILFIGFHPGPVLQLLENPVRQMMAHSGPLALITP